MGGAGKRQWALRGAVIGLAVVVALVAWRATDDDGNEASAPASSASGVPPRVVTENELADAAALTDHPVYWAGPQTSTELELTEGPNGNVTVRYLLAPDEVGNEFVDRLYVGSYPLEDPSAALDRFAKQKGSRVYNDNGRKIVVNERTPTSVYFVSPDNSVQVEVFDPIPALALSLARSGKVRPAE